MEVRLLFVGTRGFFLAASRLAIAAQFCRPQRGKNLWHQGSTLFGYVFIQLILIRRSEFFIDNFREQVKRFRSTVA